VTNTVEMGPLASLFAVAIPVLLLLFLVSVMALAVSEAVKGNREELFLLLPLAGLAAIPAAFLCLMFGL
jgi:hypothetical protein